MERRNANKRCHEGKQEWKKKKRTEQKPIARGPGYTSAMYEHTIDKLDCEVRAEIPDLVQALKRTRSDAT